MPTVWGNYSGLIMLERYDPAAMSVGPIAFDHESLPALGSAPWDYNCFRAHTHKQWDSGCPLWRAIVPNRVPILEPAISPVLSPSHGAGESDRKDCSRRTTQPLGLHWLRSVPRPQPGED